MTYYPTIAKMAFKGGGFNLKVSLRAKYIDVERLRCDKCNLFVSKKRLEDYYARKLWLGGPTSTETEIMLKDAMNNRKCPTCGEPMKSQAHQIIKISTTNIPHEYIKLAPLLRMATFFNFSEKSTKFCRNEVAAYIENLSEMQKTLENTIKHKTNLHRIKWDIQLFPVDEARLKKDYKEYYSRKLVKAL